MRKQAIWNAVHEVGIHTRAVEGLIESALVELAELQSKLVQVSNVAGVSTTTPSIVTCRTRSRGAGAPMTSAGWGARSTSWRRTWIRARA